MSRIKDFSLTTVEEFRSVLYCLLLIAHEQNNISVCDTISNTLNTIQDFEDSDELTYLLECISFKDINIF